MPWCPGAQGRVPPGVLEQERGGYHAERHETSAEVAADEHTAADDQTADQSAEGDSDAAGTGDRIAQHTAGRAAVAEPHGERIRGQPAGHGQQYPVGRPEQAEVPEAFRAQAPGGEHAGEEIRAAGHDLVGHAPPDPADPGPPRVDLAG